MFGISGTELFIIVVFVLLIFGPDKLPQFGRTVGQFMREFKRAQESMEAIIRAEVYASGNKPAPGSTADVEDELDEELDAEAGQADGAEESLPAEAASGESELSAPKPTSPFDNVAPEPEPAPEAKPEPAPEAKPEPASETKPGPAPEHEDEEDEE